MQLGGRIGAAIIGAFGLMVLYAWYTEGAVAAAIGTEGGEAGAEEPVEPLAGFIGGDGESF